MRKLLDSPWQTLAFVFFAQPSSPLDKILFTMICSKMCFTKRNWSNNKDRWYNILVCVCVCCLVCWPSHLYNSSLKIGFVSDKIGCSCKTLAVFTHGNVDLVCSICDKQVSKREDPLYSSIFPLGGWLVINTSLHADHLHSAWWVTHSHFMDLLLVPSFQTQLREWYPFPEFKEDASEPAPTRVQLVATEILACENSLGYDGAHKFIMAYMHMLPGSGTKKNQAS